MSRAAVVAQDDALVIRVDFGTLSGRALVVRMHDGAELGEPVPIEQRYVDSLYDRYQNSYGQPATSAEGTPA